MPQVQVIQPIQQQPKRLRVAAYARVSSDSTDQLNSLSVQVDYYTHLIQENPNWDFAGIYADEGITGTSTKHREQFNRLMDDCRAGLIDRVLVKSASRFARNTADALASVREMIDKLARSNAPVYVSGESGSGKERAARMIHGLGLPTTNG